MSKTIIIHPGSRWLRMGRAGDAFPVTVPNVIARRARNGAALVSPTGKGKERAGAGAVPSVPVPFARPGLHQLQT